MKKVIVFILIAAAVLFVILQTGIVEKTGIAEKFTKAEQTEKTEVVETVEQLTAVEVTSVKKDSVTDYLKFGGNVTAKDSVAVLPDTQGKIVEVLVEPGDYVEKNQIVGKLDASRAGQNYNLSPVKSPISGTVTQVNAVVGSVASPASPFAIVQTLDNLEISFSVIERYVTQIAEGNKVLVTFDAIENEVLEAYISHVNPTIDPMTRTLSVKAKLRSDDTRIKAGMFARLNVITQVKNNVPVIPYKCVSSSDEGSFVFVVRDGKAVKTVVSTGIKDGNIVEITGGLKLGDNVISVGQGLVSDGQNVKVVN